MRTFEVIAALIVAAVAFIALKILGLVLQVALFGAVFGLVVGFVVARLFKRK